MGKTRVVKDASKKVITQLDERLFRGNALAAKLFRYFVIMGLLMVIMGPLLDIVSDMVGLRVLFQYTSHTGMAVLILLAFVIISTRKVISPLRHLLADVRKLQEGDFDVDLDSEGYEEVESLNQSVKRLRNSLSIATDLLGERDRTLDKIAVEKISGVSTYAGMILPFLVYSLVFMFLSGFIYSPIIEDPLSGLVPEYFPLIQAILVLVLGVGLAILFGYAVGHLVGKPIRKLAISAERVSQGDLSVDFKIYSWGDINELSLRLADMKTAIERAMEEIIEKEGF